MDEADVRDDEDAAALTDSNLEQTRSVYQEPQLKVVVNDFPRIETSIYGDQALLMARLYRIFRPIFTTV